MKRRISIVFLALMPMLLISLGVELATFYAGYSSIRDADRAAIVEADSGFIFNLSVYIQRSGELEDLVQRTKDIYEANVPETMPTENEAMHQYFRLFTGVSDSLAYANLMEAMPEVGASETLDYSVVGFYDEARSRFVVVAAKGFASIRNYMLTGYFYNVGPEFKAGSVEGALLYESNRDVTYFADGKSNDLPKESAHMWWVMRLTDEAKVYGESRLFRDRFIPVVIITFATTVVLTFLFTFLFLILPIYRLYRSSNRYVASIEKGQVEDVFALSKHTIRTEIGTLNDSLFYMQESIKKYTAEIALSVQKEQQIASELRLAERIQLGMLPTAPFCEERFGCYGLMVPAKEVGGDFYNYFRIDEHRIGLVVGDVSGKGVPAALFMARAHTVSKLLLGDEDIETINKTLCDENEELLFVTAFFAILNTKTGDVRYINCGHEQAYLRRKGAFQPLDQEPNMPLGLDPDFSFTHQQVHLEEGDALFIYTDGLSEATDMQGELFGRFGLLEPLGQCGDARGDALIQQMWQKAKDFVGEAPQSDDACMVVLEFNQPT